MDLESTALVEHQSPLTLTGVAPAHSGMKIARSISCDKDSFHRLQFYNRNLENS